MIHLLLKMCDAVEFSRVRSLSTRMLGFSQSSAYTPLCMPYVKVSGVAQWVSLYLQFKSLGPSELRVDRIVCRSTRSGSTWWLSVGFASTAAVKR